MLELELEPVVGVYMVSLIYGFSTNRIETGNELILGEQIFPSETDT